MTESEPSAEEPERQESEDQASSPPDESPAPPTVTHLRPLPSPHPDDRRFASPSRPPPIRPRPTRPTPSPESKSVSEDAQETKKSPGHQTFPVAKPPPRPSFEDEPRTDLPKRPILQPVTEQTGLPVIAVAPDPVSTLEQESIVAEREDDSEIEAELEIEDEVAPRRGSLFGYVLYLALAVGTVPLPGEIRYTLLWMVLLALGVAFLLFDEARPLSGPVDPLPLAWGLGIGFVFSLPMMLTASRALSRTAAALVPIPGLPALFQALVVIWPLGETLFYRGAVQRDHGLVVAALAAGAGNMLLYWPETGGVFAVLFVSTIFATALGFIYGYVRTRYGLAAAFACQVTANLMLVFLPRVLAPPI